MKLAFTTLGCPKWDMARIIKEAVKMGYQGVEFRGYLGELKVYELPAFSKQVDDTASRFFDAGLEVPCFDSSARCYVEKPEEVDAACAEIAAYAVICKKFKTPYIRVFGGGLNGASREKAVDTAAAVLKRYGGVASGEGVKIAVETHDDWVDSGLLKELMQRVDPSAIVVLWDVHHPFRLAGEPPAQTWAAIGRWVRHTHFKDSVRKEGLKGSHQLCLTGSGDIPLKEILKCLKGGGYSGYVSLEWEKMWHKELGEPEEAFPQFARYIKGLEGEL